MRDADGEAARLEADADTEVLVSVDGGIATVTRLNAATYTVEYTCERAGPTELSVQLRLGRHIEPIRASPFAPYVHAAPPSTVALAEGSGLPSSLALFLPSSIEMAALDQFGNLSRSGGGSLEFHGDDVECLVLPSNNADMCIDTRVDMFVDTVWTWVWICAHTCSCASTWGSTWGSTGVTICA